ncbi:hypothetical protein ANO11243_096400 [Dothideomycetidae sp. 11243]|nr:hypothetical protein ANO11243_096400 [fungal sp. No.11243]
MDEDERLLASEEGKKLSSKERRQLRNKVSARAFRSRRKDRKYRLDRGERTLSRAYPDSAAPPIFHALYRGPFQGSGFHCFSRPACTKSAPSEPTSPVHYARPTPASPPHLAAFLSRLTRSTTLRPQQAPFPTLSQLQYRGFTACTIARLHIRERPIDALDVIPGENNLLPAFSKPVWSRVDKFGISVVPMKAYFQFLTTPTSDTNGTALLLHFDQKRYVFGNLTEGTQRAFVQQGLKAQKVSEIFISGRTEWKNVGGLLGFVLTLADTTSEAASSAAELLRTKIAKARDERAREKAAQALERMKQEQNRANLTIFGPANLNYVLATARKFIFRTSIPLVAKEIPRLFESRPSDELGPAVYAYQDANIRVWALAVPPVSESPSTVQSKTGRKRSHEDMIGIEGAATQTSNSSHDVATNVVRQMFSSDWRIDRLMECSINEVKLPAKVFTRDPETKELKQYMGPFPSQDNPVPDIRVLVRSPWPGAVMAPRLPRPTPSQESISYIVKTWPQRGKFDPRKALAFGLTDKNQYGQLTQGIALQNDKGETITPEMVLGPDREGTAFIVADLPSAEYVAPFLKLQAAVPESTMSNISAYVWILGPQVAENADLVHFMQSTKSVQHIMTAPDACPDRLSFDSAAGATAKLAAVDPVRYKVPVVRETAKSSIQSELAIIADRGLTLNLEPNFKLSTGEINPPMDYAPVLDELSAEVRLASKTALEEVEKDRVTLDAWARKVEQPDAEIITLGTGSALPSKYRNVSGTLVKVPGWGNILLDAGENTVGQMKRVFSEEEYLAVLRGLRTIWISHLHADHHLGTASVIKEWYKAVHDQQTCGLLDPVSSDVDISALIGAKDRLTVMSDSAMLHWLWEYSQVEDIGFSWVNPVCVTPAALKHSINTRLHWFNPQLSDASPGNKVHLDQQVTTVITPETLGFKDIQAVFVRHCNGALGMALTLPSDFKVSYSGDCRPSLDLAEIGHGSTVCIHEATFDDELRSDARAKNHSTTAEALSVATKMQAKAVVLTHFSQRYAKVPVLEYTDEDDDAAAEELLAGEDTPGDVDMAGAGGDGPSGAGQGNAEDGSGGKSTFRLKSDSNMKVCVAFDYMRVKVGEIAHMEKFVPALLALYDGGDDGGKANDKQRGINSARQVRKKKLQTEQNSMVLLHHLPRETREIKTRLLIHDLPQIRLREHRQRIPRHFPTSDPRRHAPDIVRHSSESPLCDALQRLARLER